MQRLNWKRATFAAGLAMLALPAWALLAAPPSAATQFKTLYRFKNAGDLNPMARLFLAPDGKLYGTTTGGGFGSVFSLTPPIAPGDPWTEEVLHNFVNNGVDGFSPWGGVIMAPDGKLYGMTIDGGTSACVGGCGAIYQLSPPISPSAPWTEAILYSFTGDPDDGNEPLAALIRDSDGTFYGTTLRGGGSANCDTGCGTVFKMTIGAGTHPVGHVSLLHVFDDSDGSAPSGAVTLGPDGALYGTTSDGGANGFGTVFRLSPPLPGKHKWKHTVLHHFGSSDSDGTRPYAAVVFDADGALYGTTQLGGGAPACGLAGCGTVFKLTPPLPGHNKWPIKILYAFQGGPADGKVPMSDLIFDSTGALFGTTSQGGSANCVDGGCGIVFKLIPPAPGKNKWKEKVLHLFQGGNTGATPYSGVIADPSDVLYGVTFGGSDFGNKRGTAYKITQ